MITPDTRVSDNNRVRLCPFNRNVPVYTMIHNLWVICAFIPVIFQIGQSFECYQCTTDKSQECWKVDYKDTFQKVVCTKRACLTVQLPSIGGIERLARDCYQEEYCDKYSICKRCDEPLCNSSSSLNPRLIVLLITVTCFLILRLK